MNRWLKLVYANQLGNHCWLYMAGVLMDWGEWKEWTAPFEEWMKWAEEERYE